MYCIVICISSIFIVWFYNVFNNLICIVFFFKVANKNKVTLRYNRSENLYNTNEIVYNTIEIFYNGNYTMQIEFIQYKWKITQKMRNYAIRIKILHVQCKWKIIEYK